MRKEGRKRKKAQSVKIKRLKKDKCKELSQDLQRLGIPEMCSIAKIGLRQLKGKNTRNEGQICYSQAPEMQQEKQKAQSNHSQYKGTVPRGTRMRSYKKGSSSKDLQTSRDGFRLLGKNDKEEGRPKAEP